MATYCIRCQDKEVEWEDMLCKDCSSYDKLKIKKCFNCGETASENFFKCDYHDIYIGVCKKEECYHKGIQIRCNCDLS